jgi:hypothetical protein
MDTVFDVLQEVPGDHIVIAHTMHTEQSPIAAHRGFDGFLAKPIDESKFPSLIARILAGESIWFVAGS